MMRYGFWALLLVGASVQSGCGIFKTELDKCREQQEYQSARTGERAQIPEGLDPLSEDEWLPVPAGETNTTPTPPEQTCLIEPPEYRRN